MNVKLNFYVEIEGPLVRRVHAVDDGTEQEIYRRWFETGEQAHAYAEAARCTRGAATVTVVCPPHPKSVSRPSPACPRCADHYGDAGTCDEGKPVQSPHRASAS